MDIREYLLKVRREHGLLTPGIVVEVSRPVEAPLHSHFEWDDARAADLHRLEQAREIIRSVKITYVDGDGAVARTRAFASIQMTSPAVRAYVPVEEIAADPVLTELALRDAEREWRSLFTRYRHLKGFLDSVREDLRGAEE